MSAALIAILVLAASVALYATRKVVLFPLLEKVLFEPMRRTEAESRAYMSSDEVKDADTKVMVILVTSAISLFSTRARNSL